MFLTNLAKYALHVLAPPFCAYCRLFLDKKAPLCPRCMATICPIVSTSLYITSSRQMRIFAVCDYQEPLKSLILAKQWGDINASKQLAELIWQLTPISALPFDVLIPIPLHWTRYASRGYNQAQVMAERLSTLSGKPMKRMLKRIKKTAFQASISAHERPINITNAFSLTGVDGEQIRDKHIVLVDDLMTTGVTLKEAARQLLPLKPEQITAVVGCRVL